MSFPSPRDGLSLDQAPPLSIPASFFLLAPLAMVAAGLLLLWSGAAPFGAGPRPDSLALTHLGTLGLLGSVMIGALYQMAPVVAGAPVPAIRLAYGVWGAWALGVAGLVLAFLTGTQTLYAMAGGLLGAALAGFIVPVVAGLLRAPTANGTVWGMRIAVVALAVVGLLGLGFVALRSGNAAPTRLLGFDVATWRMGHFGLGLVGWVGALLAAVSWQILPMFYLAPEVPKKVQGLMAAAAGFSVVAAAVVLLSGRGWIAAALAPAGIAALAAHPALSLPRLKARQRKRRDETVTAWMAALACGPVAGLCAVIALAGGGPRFGVAFVWVAVLGWAGLAVHGMLCRIVPFLVWFHRLSPLVGKVKVPPVRRLMPQDAIRQALEAHAVAVVAGVLAIATGWDPFARAAGMGLLLAGGLLGANLWRVLRFRPDEGPALTAR